MRVKSNATSVWFDEETLAILERLTAEAGTSRSQVIREAIRRMADDGEYAEIRRLVADLAKAVLG